MLAFFFFFFILSFKQNKPLDQFSLMICVFLFCLARRVQFARIHSVRPAMWKRRIVPSSLPVQCAGSMPGARIPVALDVRVFCVIPTAAMLGAPCHSAQFIDGHNSSRAVNKSIGIFSAFCVPSMGSASRRKGMPCMRAAQHAPDDSGCLFGAPCNGSRFVPPFEHGPIFIGSQLDASVRSIVRNGHKSSDRHRVPHE